MPLLSRRIPGFGARGRAVHRARWSSAIAASTAAAFFLAACGTTTPSASVSSTSAPLTTVTVGIGPFLDNQTLALAQQLGYAKAEGIQFKFVTLPSNGAIFSAIESGSIDMGAGTMRGIIPLAATAPTLRNFIIRDQFLGNFLVGRKSQHPLTYSGLVAAGESPNQARRNVLLSLRGKAVDIIAVQNLPPITSALKSVGIDPSLLHVNNFSTDALASLAFENGTGNYYTGNLVTQSTLLLNHPNEYVDVGGGTQVLGGAGLSYDSWTSSQGWLSAHHQLALKIVAVVLKVNRYIQQRLGSAAPALARLTNAAASSNLSVPVVKQLVSKYETFLTPAQLGSQVFNASSPDYWLNETKLDMKANAGVLPPNFNPRTLDPAQKYFKEYEQNAGLVKFVNGPL